MNDLPSRFLMQLGIRDDNGLGPSRPEKAQHGPVNNWAGVGAESKAPSFRVRARPTLSSAPTPYKSLKKLIRPGPCIVVLSLFSI